MERTILTPLDQRWGDFINNLAERAFDVDGDQLVPTTRNCDGTLDLVAKTLAAMGGVDVQATLEDLKDHNADCTCEILFDFELKERYKPSGRTLVAVMNDGAEVPVRGMWKHPQRRR